MFTIRVCCTAVLAAFLGGSLWGEEKREAAPEFPKGATWLQSKPKTFKALKGRVVILHFWTYGCINCQRNYPAYKAWLKKYDGKDVTILGVHTPEFSTEKDAERVKLQAKNNGLTFPIVLDNDMVIWKAWRTRYWPTIFLIDKQGVIRYHWEGELHLDKDADKRFASRIDELLAEKANSR